MRFILLILMVGFFFCSPPRFGFVIIEMHCIDTAKASCCCDTFLSYKPERWKEYMSDGVWRGGDTFIQLYQK